VSLGWRTIFEPIDLDDWCCASCRDDPILWELEQWVLSTLVDRIPLLELSRQTLDPGC